MKSVSLSSERHVQGTSKPGMLNGLARTAVMNQLDRLVHGRLELEENGVVQRFGDPDAETSTKIYVRDSLFYSDIAFGGSIGGGEAYMHGRWDCDDLVGLVRLLLRNRPVLEGMEGGLAWLTRPVQGLYHRVNRNSREGARRNIAAHYDLGNEFFGLWLDRSMMYSAAIFPTPEASLREAQEHRLRHICEKLRLSRDDHVVEIGTGWGGFAVYAARNYGCRVTTTTISSRQYEYARQRIIDEGLHDRVTVLKDDFRDLSGQYDKLVSIEMIEAIDHDLFGPLFRKCSDLLKPDGAMLLQAITIADQRYDEYRKSIDFIQRYIFPGSGLPSSAVMTAAVAKHTDLRLLDLEDIGLHYATTLNRWRRRFFAAIEDVRDLGYTDTFIRMWEYYLCYCEGAFLERAISDVQVVYTKPESRLQPCAK